MSRGSGIPVRTQRRKNLVQMTTDRRSMPKRTSSAWSSAARLPPDPPNPAPAWDPRPEPWPDRAACAARIHRTSLRRDMHAIPDSPGSAAALWIPAAAKLNAIRTLARHRPTSLWTRNTSQRSRATLKPPHTERTPLLNLPSHSSEPRRRSAASRRTRLRRRNPDEKHVALNLRTVCLGKESANITLWSATLKPKHGVAPVTAAGAPR